MSEPCDLSLVDAAKLIASRGLSPVELTQSALKRVEHTEPKLHAFVAIDADRALASAKTLEAELATGTHRGPLHGIPMGVKDIFDLEGVPTRCNSCVRADAGPASRDAKSVANARAAGAVFLGKTVTQEFAAGVISDPARNPWDPSRIPGGSSGGSGASVAAGSTIASFGSDTGGSIRNPAAINGVVGLKPTFGAVDTSGVYPLSWSLDTVGPLARTVHDAALVLNVFAGWGDDRDAAAEIGQSIAGLRIGLLRSFFFDRLQPEIASAVEAAASTLTSLGAEVIDVDWPEARIARAASFVINRVEGCEVHAEAIRATPELFGEELRLRLESNSLYPATGFIRAQKARGIAKRSIAELFTRLRLDAVIAPTSAGTAAPANDLTVAYPDGSTEPVNLAYTRLTMPFNATGQPVVAVPCGFDSLGLPIGMQVVGRPHAEARICRIAHAYEQAAGWFRRRPPIIES
jgi:aspartyl-tRNA(Asn)/glutamyl-tRNA(Gln) amidotransferase subunit A